MRVNDRHFSIRSRRALGWFDRVPIDPSRMASVPVEETANRRVFTKLPDPPSDWAFGSNSTRSFLRKWDLAGNGRVCRFRYTNAFHRMNPDGFLCDFFNSDEVNEHFKVLGGDKQWRSVRAIANETKGDTIGEANPIAERKTKTKCTSVKYEKIQCTATSMRLFDPLSDGSAEPWIVRKGSDSLMKRIEDIIDGFPVADELRAFLLDSANENVENELIPESDREEFLWKIFTHLVLGRSSCQYEETLSPYVDTAKALYKSLVRAKRKEGSSGDSTEAVVVSDVYEVKKLFLGNSSDGENTQVSIFPKPNNRQNFTYLCVEPGRKICTVWYHGYVPYW